MLSGLVRIIIVLVCLCGSYAWAGEWGEQVQDICQYSENIVIWPGALSATMEVSAPTPGWIVYPTESYIEPQTRAWSYSWSNNVLIVSTTDEITDWNDRQIWTVLSKPEVAE